MAIDQVDRTVVTQEPVTATGRETVQTESRRTTTAAGPGGSEFAAESLRPRLRADPNRDRSTDRAAPARCADGQRSRVGDSQRQAEVFVAPFEGILRTDALSRRRLAVLDVAAVVAFVGSVRHRIDRSSGRSGSPPRSGVIVRVLDRRAEAACTRCDHVETEPGGDPS